MLPERIKPLLRTSAWRFTLVFSTIFFVIFCFVVISIYKFTIGAQKENLEHNLAVISHELFELSQSTTMRKTEFGEIVQSRTERSTSLILALADDDRLVFGNLNRIPAQLPAFPRHQYFPIVVHDFSGEPVIRTAIGTRLETPFGSLTIAIFDDNQQIVERNFWGVTAIVLCGVLIITFLAGFLFSRYVLSRIREISRLTAEVKSGRLELRLPISKRHDEFDNIAEQINHMLDEIDELIQSVASVTDNIAHDLRTPLSRMRLSIEQSMANPQLNEDEVLWRERLLEETDYLIGIFNAMLELTTLEKGVYNSVVDDCDLASICSDVVELALPLADEKSQHITLYCKQPEIIKGNRDLLFRAIYNLVENAIKYTQEDGSIIVTVAGVRLVVSDNGPGIPPDERERIFQRLYRMDKSRSDQSYGLGMSIVNAIIKLHHASIQLDENQPGLKVTLDFNRAD